MKVETGFSDSFRRDDMKPARPRKPRPTRGAFSVKKILAELPYIEHEHGRGSADAKHLARVVKTLLETTGCNNDRVDAALARIDRIIGGYGVEAIRIDDTIDHYYQDIAALYVNVGDTYNGTVVFDTKLCKFTLETMGDWIERAERRGVKVL